MIINLLYYISSCCSSICNKLFLHILSLGVISSLGYNLYLYNDINNECKNHYKKENLWDYYIYLLIILGINSILICLIYLYNCLKN